MSGNSSTHGGQVVAMKLTQTGWPRSTARSTVPPPTCGTDSGGATSPMWKAAEPGPGLSLASGEGPDDAPGAPEGDVADEATALAAGLPDAPPPGAAVLSDATGAVGEGSAPTPGGSGVR